jgi:fatty-acyl-CoA synthase
VRVSPEKLSRRRCVQDDLDPGIGLVALAQVDRERNRFGVPSYERYIQDRIDESGALSHPWVLHQLMKGAEQVGPGVRTRLCMSKSAHSSSVSSAMRPIGRFERGIRSTMRLWDSLLAPLGSAPLEVDGVRTSWTTLVARSGRIGAALRKRGIQPGDAVGCVLSNSAESCAALLGIWRAGGTAVSLPASARGQAKARYLAQLDGLCRLADVRTALAEDALASQIRSFAEDAVQWLGYTGLDSDSPPPTNPPSATAPAFVQFSSGTTGRPRGVILTSEAIDAQLDLLAHALGLQRGDRGCMWLPLSHDMGLFGGLLLCWSRSLGFLLGTPSSFVAQPRSWFENCARFDATLTAAPNLALNVVTRAFRATSVDPPRLRLRACILGGERIRADTLQRASPLLERCGVGPAIITPAYGLAEVTLAATMTAIEAPPRTVTVDGAALAQRRLRLSGLGDSGEEIVSVGKPLGPTEVRIEGDDPMGPIWLRSPSNASGYIGDADSTRARFVDGWVNTGDIGFAHRDEIYVVGRDDDTLVLAGQNIPALEIEAILSDHPAVRPGACAVVDAASGTVGSLAAFVETVEDADLAALSRELSRLALRETGVAITDWTYLHPGCLPKTPSGKIQRYALCQRAVDPEAIRGRIRQPPH